MARPKKKNSTRERDTEPLPAAQGGRPPVKKLLWGGLLLIGIGYLGYSQASPSIRYNVSVGDIDVGGLTREEAAPRISRALPKGDITINLVIENKNYPIASSDIDLRYNVSEAVQQAWDVGRSKGSLKQMRDLVTLPFITVSIPISYSFDSAKLRNEIETIAVITNEPGKDIRLHIEGDSIEILHDTKLGFVLDQDRAYRSVMQAIENRTLTTPSQTLAIITPTVSLKNAERAREQARRIMTQPLTMVYEKRSFTVDEKQLGSWIVTKPSGEQLSIDVSEQLVSNYVVTLAKELNAEARDPKVIVVDNKVVDFTPPHAGKKLDQDTTVRMIAGTLLKRRDAEEAPAELSLPIAVERPAITDASAAELGIIELIGSASTRFTGSPKNRISNIKNGVKFLNSILIKQGEEFSTLKALGNIDNTTGYLPELVIKENRTIPEYGGGLCQVSTTLFRAVLNTGVPILARRNHSYRVSYYEKDGDGNYIGPGLDATIYNAAPDFRFLNDTPAAILIEGFVEGDKITFNFYGTSDGRTAAVDGPKKLSETPAGEPIYTETDTLKPGEKKQIEKPHPGGTAITTYTITYPDGTVKTEEFKSHYRNWPAQFLVGIDPSKATSTAATLE